MPHVPVWVQLETIRYEYNYPTLMQHILAAHEAHRFEKSNC
jgi:hypothetical protein